MTLEQQYKYYLHDNPESNFTYNDWMIKVMKPFAKDAIRQIEELNRKKESQKMSVRLMEDYDIDACLFEGTVIQGAFEDGEFYTGLFASMFGSFEVSIPMNICEVIKK